MDISASSQLHQEITHLMKTYGNDVLRTAYLYVKDSHLSEDIFQEVFIKVFRNYDSFQGKSDIRTWIIRITINTCKDYLKSSYHRNTVPVMEPASEQTVSDISTEVEQKEQNHQIRSALLSLPEKYRNPLVLVYFHQLSVKETADVLQTKENTVKSLLKRGRDLLKKTLKGGDFDES